MRRGLLLLLFPSVVRAKPEMTVEPPGGATIGGNQMSVEENKAILRRFLEAWNPRDGGDWELCAEDLVIHGPEGDANLEGLRQGSNMWFSAFPDLQGTIEDIVAEGDRVVTRESWRGTHEGEFMGIAPTGRQIMIATMSMVRISDGRIVEYWEGRDRLQMLEQLGAVPPMGEGRE